MKTQIPKMNSFAPLRAAREKLVALQLQRTGVEDELQKALSTRDGSAKHVLDQQAEAVLAGKTADEATTKLYPRPDVAAKREQIAVLDHAIAVQGRGDAGGASRQQGHL